MKEASKILQEFQEIAKKTFSAHVYNSWIQNIIFRIHDPINAPNSILRIYLCGEDERRLAVIGEKFLEPITRIFEKLSAPRKVSVCLEPLQTSLNLLPPDPPPQHPPLYTFDNFILGPSNQFAHAAAKAIVHDPGKCFNPLFIFGDSGLGKTHLIRAIAREIGLLYPKRQVCYFSSEQFLADVMSHSIHKTLPEFRKKYPSSLGILLLDDIELLNGKEQAQEEFFYIFNKFYDSNQQIVITSDTPPQSLSGLEGRMRTRFEWGLVADIHPPSFDTRSAILRQKMESMNFILDIEIVEFLASHFTKNVRELEGILHKLFFLQSLQPTPVPLTLPVVKAHLRPFLSLSQTAYPVDKILQVVADAFGCHVTEIKSELRSRDISLSRHVSMYLIRKYTEKSYPEIGQVIGNKDHTTVIHGVRKISRLLGQDKTLKDQVQDIEDRLSQDNSESTVSTSSQHF